MKKWMMICGLGLLALSGCVREEVPYYPVTNAAVQFDYWSDRYGTDIEGEIYNDGETYIDAVQLEVRTYDNRGFIIDYEYFWLDTYFYPGDVVGFTLRSPITYAANVEVYVNSIE
jgi:hypothetical protein